MVLSLTRGALSLQSLNLHPLLLYDILHLSKKIKTTILKCVFFPKKNISKLKKMPNKSS